MPGADEDGVGCWLLGYGEPWAPEDRCVRICPASVSDVWSIASELDLRFPDCMVKFERKDGVKASRRSVMVVRAADEAVGDEVE